MSSTTKEKAVKKNRVKLTDSEREWLANKINSLNPDYRCTFCGHDKQIIAGSIVHPVEAIILPNGKFATPVQGSVYPCIQTFCENCGRVEFFNTHALGFIPEGTEATDGS